MVVCSVNITSLVCGHRLLETFSCPGNRVTELKPLTFVLPMIGGNLLLQVSPTRLRFLRQLTIQVLVFSTIQTLYKTIQLNRFQLWEVLAILDHRHSEYHKYYLGVHKERQLRRFRKMGASAPIFL